MWPLGFLLAHTPKPPRPTMLVTYFKSDFFRYNYILSDMEELKRSLARKILTLSLCKQWRIKGGAVAPPPRAGWTRQPALPKIGQRGGKNNKKVKKWKKNLFLARNLSLHYGSYGTIILTSQYEFLRVFAS